MKLLAILLIALQVNVALAETCIQPVTAVKKGDASPCDGYLFSKEKEAEVKQKVQDGELANQQVEIQAKQLMLYKDQTELYQGIAKKREEESELWRTKAIETTKEYTKSQTSDKLENIALFGGGVVVGIGIAYLASMIVKNVAK